jgi:hypothetical protein
MKNVEALIFIGLVLIVVLYISYLKGGRSNRRRRLDEILHQRYSHSATLSPTNASTTSSLGYHKPSSTHAKPFSTQMLDMHEPSVAVESRDSLGIRMSNGSKGETICGKVLEDIFKVPFHTVRPDFLQNPRTGQNLELDRYNHELKLALEYDGEHHRSTGGKHPQTQEQLEYQQWKDAFKAQRCRELGITLIKVPSTLHFSKISDYIIDRLKEVGYVDEIE